MVRLIHCDTLRRMGDLETPPCRSFGDIEMPPFTGEIPQPFGDSNNPPARVLGEVETDGAVGDSSNPPFGDFPFPPVVGDLETMP